MYRFLCVGLLLAVPAANAAAGSPTVDDPTEITFREEAPSGSPSPETMTPGAGADTAEVAAGEQPPSPADQLVESLPRALRDLTAEVLVRNPQVARARAEAIAAEQRAPQVRALPDPMAAITAFLLTPETRVGPQRFTLGVSQRYPWFGKLDLREQQVLYQAAAARQDVEAQRLALVTETLRLCYELTFLAEHEMAVRADRATLLHYEELARARYASGVGLEQSVVKIQAEITKDDNRLLEIEKRRASLTATLNALRDLPATTPVPAISLPEVLSLPGLEITTLRQRAVGLRPEVAKARALIAAAETGIELAKKDYKPDFNFGFGYTVVDRRSDSAGRAMPPEGNGDDIFGVTAGVSLPVWRQKLAAGLAEATHRQTSAQEALRGVIAGIEQSLGDLTDRLSLTRQQVELFDQVLTVQAAEALRSAEAAYAAGTLNALDLLDAERVLLEVQIGAARVRADYAVALARLEGAVAAPLHPDSSGE